MEREALKLALEALESGVKTTSNRISWTEYDTCLMNDAITAIHEVLAQSAHEPDMLTIAYQSGYYDGKKAALAGREWVGLTPENILALFDEHNLYGSKLVEFARAVETKIKDKNT
jgi:predicted enzyme involved in methoxymalonyl-ACP biosynthesis